MVNKSFFYPVAERLVKIFAKHRVEYLIIGKSGAILYGFPDTTQDIDIFPQKDKENGKRIVGALRELGFEIDKTLETAIIEGKDFIQIRGGPFDLDLVFAPDGIDSFEDAKKRANLIGGIFSVAALEDIIKSKKTAGRKRDKEVLARLEEFHKFLKKSKFK
ncbi:MAG: hypothetical protein ACPL28_08680 [bacterium]